MGLDAPAEKVVSVCLSSTTAAPLRPAGTDVTKDAAGRWEPAASRPPALQTHARGQNELLDLYSGMANVARQPGSISPACAIARREARDLEDVGASCRDAPSGGARRFKAALAC